MDDAVVTTEEEYDEEDFRFPWEILSEFYATFTQPKSEGELVYVYDCCLSRVYLNDKELVKLSRRKPVSLLNAEDISDFMETMNIHEQNNDNIVSVVENPTAESDSHIDEQDGDNTVSVVENSTAESDSHLEGEGTIPFEMNKDAWAELPKRFGDRVKAKYSPYLKKRKRSGDEARKWLCSITFDEYWEETSPYLIYRTWYEDYGYLMNEDDRNELARKVDECKPMVLIDDHTEEKLSKYYGISKDVQFSSYEELFALHSKLVMQLAFEDFERYRSTLSKHRCKTFLKKVENMGFVPGYNDADIEPTNGTQLSEPNGLNLHDVAPSLKRRFPVDYSDDAVFSDVKYDIYDRAKASVSVVLDRDEGSPKEEDTVKDEDFEKRDVNLLSEISENEVINVPSSEVSFAFDSVKDAHLLAINAFDAYRDDKEIIKYWYQRYRLFSKLDEGVILDREGWFSVTPERIAEHIADRIVRRPEMLVVDAFAGVGGNTIQLALKGARVIAIDLDPIRLKCARENARVYGVEDRVEFICCDFFHFVSKWIYSIGNHAQVDAVFLSPPWGGPSYLKSKVFDLDDLSPNGFDIFTAAKEMSPNIAYFLPRTTPLKQLISLSGPGGRCEIEQSWLNSKIKTLTAYYGNLAVQRSQ